MKRGLAVGLQDNAQGCFGAPPSGATAGNCVLCCTFSKLRGTALVWLRPASTRSPSHLAVVSCRRGPIFSTAPLRAGSSQRWQMSSLATSSHTVCG